MTEENQTKSLEIERKIQITPLRPIRTRENKLRRIMNHGGDRQRCTKKDKTITIEMVEICLQSRVRIFNIEIRTTKQKRLVPLGLNGYIR